MALDYATDEERTHLLGTQRTTTAWDSSEAMGANVSLGESINAPLIQEEEGVAAYSPFPSMSRANSRESAGIFIADKASEYSYCMVFPRDGEHLNDYCSNLTRFGLELFVYREKSDKNGQGKIFVLIRAPVKILRDYADMHNVRMLLDEKNLQQAAEGGFPSDGIDPINILHYPEVVKYRPYQLIHAKYSTNKGIDEALYYRNEGESHPFERDCMRLKLINTMIESAPPGGGQNLKIKRYIRYGRILGFFALHDAGKLEPLYRIWLHSDWSMLLPWNAPVFEIKEYFGEKTGLYFAFMGHYNKWLCIPAFVGVPIQLGVFLYSARSVYSGFDSAPFLPAFSFCLALWAIFMLEFWKRKENKIAMEWGMSGEEDRDIVQPEFRGDRIKSFVDGKDYIFYPTSKRNSYIAQSSMAILGLTLLVLGVVASIYTIKGQLVNVYGFSVSNAQTAASIINSLEIQVTNLLYTFLANELTSRENHRTQHDHDDSLIVKIFVFQFINSFASFYFLAFFVEYIAELNCGENGCMFTLALNLIIIFIIRIASAQIFNLVIPWFVYTYKKEGGSVVNIFLQRTVDSKSRPENEFMLEPYDANQAFVEDMMDSVIQFGYMSLFVTAFPCTALLALISNCISLKGKAWKLLRIHQRPAPVGCEDIGAFQSIMLFTACAAVITNAALAVFTMTVFDSFSENLQFWVFILFQWICFSAQAIIMEAIPDEPESIVFHKKRSEFLESKIIDRVEDDHVELIEGGRCAPEIQEYPQRGGYFSIESHNSTGEDKIPASVAAVAAVSISSDNSL